MRFRDLIWSCVINGFVTLTLSSKAFSAAVTFQDWKAVCEQDGYCFTETADRNKVAGPFKIGRVANARAIWELSVKTLDDNPSLFGPATVRVAGQRLIKLSPNRDFATFGSDNEFFLINSASLQPLFRRMIESRRVFFSFDGVSRQKINASYSLNGLAAALIWIDEQQGRLGSRRIAGPPAKRAALTATDADSAVFDPENLALETHAGSNIAVQCDAGLQDETQTHPLDEQNTLVVIPCTTRSSVLYLVNEKNQSARPLDWQGQ